MQVLVSVDMEGVAGIATRGQVVPGAPDYGVGRALMTREASAAVDGAFAGGATAVVVNDSHGPMDNLLGEELDPRAEYVVGSPKPLAMVEGLDADTGVALFVGYHAGPQDHVGVLAHSFSSLAFADLRLNGEELTELRLNALVAATHGVPVGLVTGDDVVCALAERQFPGVVVVPVKRAIGRTAARTLHPATARDRIRAGARAAVEAATAGALAPLPVPPTLVVEAEFRPHGAAELAALVPGSERVGARVVRREVRDHVELLDVVMTWSSLTSAYLAST